jgi:hypothetical protein
MFVAINLVTTADDERIVASRELAEAASEAAESARAHAE